MYCRRILLGLINKKWAYALGSSILLSVLPASVGAQDEPKSSTPVLEEIIVSAQKRLQTAQDVPIAVTAVSGEDLANFTVSNFDDIEVPGLVVARGGMADTVSIRGVGSDTNLGFEQSVPTYIDGVYYGRARIQRFAFLDVQNVEVLKGPQPTYLGKNAVAGAINISSRKPGTELGGNISAFYEINHQEIGIEGGIDIPIGENVRTRTAIKFRDLSDGWVRNLASNDSEPNIQDILGRFTAEIDLSDDLMVTAQIYGGKNEDDGRNNQPFNCQDAFFTSGVSDPALETCEIDFEKASFGEVPNDGTDELFFQGTNGAFLNDLEIGGGNLIFNWDIGEYTVTSVSAYYAFKNRLQADGDHGTSNFFTANFVEDFSQFSQEIRVLSPRGETIEWVAGFNYDTNNNDNLQAPNINGSALITRIPGPNPSGNTFTRFREVEEDAESWAVFFDGTVNISDAFRVSAGFRYTEVTKDATILTCSATIFTRNCLGPVNQTGGAFTFTQSRKDTDFQPAVVVEWSPNDAVNLFASYKESFKAGGFDHALNAPNADAFNFDPESARAYELGAKTRFMDGRASLDIVLFHNTFENLQVSIFSGQGISFNVDNAAESRSQGIEIDGRFAATDYLTLGVAFQYLDSEFTNYPGAPCYTRQTAEQGCLVPAGGGPAVQDLTGRQRPQAPEYTATFTADWDIPISEDLSIIGGLNLFLSDGFFSIADLDPLSYQDNYEKLDARIGLSHFPSGWSVSLVSRNLTNSVTAPWRGDCPFGVCTIALVDRSRTFAIQVSGSF